MVFLGSWDRSWEFSENGSGPAQGNTGHLSELQFQPIKHRVNVDHPQDTHGKPGFHAAPGKGPCVSAVAFHFIYLAFTDRFS